MPGFKTKVKELQALAKSAPNKAYKEKANKVVQLYADKKITNFRTAENALLRLSQPRSIKSGRADVEYEKIVKRYEEAEPMTGRLTRESLRKKIKTYSATLILFKKTEDWDKDKEPDPTLLVPTAGKNKG
jgi:hypothetical protein